MEFFWIAAIGIVVTLLVATGILIFAPRKPLPPAEDLEELESGSGETIQIEQPETPSEGEDVVPNEDDQLKAGEVSSAQSDVDTSKEPSDSGTAEPLDVPDAPTSRLVRLRRKLAAGNNPLARGLLAMLSSDKLSEETWEDFETTLISADLGVAPTTELCENLRKHFNVEGVTDPAKAKEILRAELLRLVNPEMDRSLNLNHEPGTPAVVMMVGVNGTGKTTTVGKLARILVADQQKVLLGAADTFRAAAAQQLQTWGERVGVKTVAKPEGSDPASVAFEAVDTGIKENADVVLVDTAGRLHTKTGLMDELGKVKRVIEKKAPVSEVLLVLDATTGQNGLTQARIFADVVQVTGIVLTKLDGSAKGGIVVQVQQELGVPVKFIGLGEGPDDLAPFDAEQFVDALLSQD